MKRILLLLCIVFLFSLSGCMTTERTTEELLDSVSQSSSSQERSELTYSFVVLSTTDMHGRATALDLASGKPQNNNIAQVSTVVSEIRERYGSDNVLLIDNGDFLTGTLTTQYAASIFPTDLNPMTSAMIAIGYDAVELGNHEFNYLPPVRDAQVQYLLDAGIPVLGSNIVCVDAGKNIHDAPVGPGDPYYDPYAIYTLDAGEGRSVRVAVLGIENASCDTWDLPRNYEGLQFFSSGNKDRFLENEINKWTDYLTANDLADVIVVAAHSGLTTGSGMIGGSSDMQALPGVKGARNVDLFIFGHDHKEYMEHAITADGKDIYMANGGGTSVTKNVFTVTFHENGKVKSVNVTGSLLPLSDAENDPDIVSLTDTWYYRTLSWAESALGTFAEGWTQLAAQAKGKTNEEMLNSQTALTDLIHKVSIWGSWLNYETDGIEGATVSLFSPCFAENESGILSYVPGDGDDISILDLSKLYSNTEDILCTVDMTPAELWDWMNRVANGYDLKDGTAFLKNSAAVSGMDTFYGLDYTIDLTRPEGSRITSVTYQGEPLENHQGKIRVALSSSSLSGDALFFNATGISLDDAVWTSIDGLGESRASFVSLIGEYASSMGQISPLDPVSHGMDSQWQILTERPVEPSPDAEMPPDAEVTPVIETSTEAEVTPAEQN